MIYGIYENGRDSSCLIFGTSELCGAAILNTYFLSNPQTRIYSQLLGIGDTEVDLCQRPWEKDKRIVLKSLLSYIMTAVLKVACSGSSILPNHFVPLNFPCPFFSVRRSTYHFFVHVLLCIYSPPASQCLWRSIQPASIEQTQTRYVPRIIANAARAAQLRSRS